MSDQALRDIKQIVERWRYKTGACPACHGSPHTSECVIVAIVTRIDSALSGTPAEAKFIQLVAVPAFESVHEDYLLALDADGRVWERTSEIVDGRRTGRWFWLEAPGAEREYRS